MSYEIICAACGKKFTATRRNTKYCSPLCRSAGAKATRKQWEQDTDYNESQRLLMRKRRREEREAVKAAAAEAARKRHNEIMEEARALYDEMLVNVRKRAEEGNLFAKLQLAEDRGDYMEFWRFRRLMILESEEQYHYVGQHSIGGEDPHEEHFEFFVLENVRERARNG